LYRTSRWQRLRLRQLEAEPLCQWCLQSEIIEEATEVHHVHPHKGDLDLFWNGPFVSTCKPCHSSRGQLEDHGKKVIVFGADGWPIGE
jgi:5-methylcytosine-specific restriction endonuclease McrA